MKSDDDLLNDPEPFGDEVEPAVAQRLIALARSTRVEDTNRLIELGMTRGLRHPRFAVQAIEAEFGQRFGEQSLAVATRQTKIAQYAFWATVLAALAAVANVVAVILA